MINPVSFCSTGTKAIYTPKKKSTKTGTAIGAGLGLALCVTNGVRNRGYIAAKIQEGIQNGMSKNKSVGLAVVGLAIAGAIIVGAGALIGKGANAIVNHFKKDKVNPKDVMV